jgi:hypothetical protein
MSWEGFLDWLGSWNDSQGFWTAVQGVGTVLAAVAAMFALAIARSQLSELIRSNKLLADSNDAMTHSNIALTRPYVVVDFEFRPFVDRSGSVRSTTIAVRIENAGRTPAKNVRLRVDPAFPLPGEPEHSRFKDWRDAVKELNRVTNGRTVIRSLTHVRSLSYYLSETADTMRTAESAAGSWTVTATYEDNDGHVFEEETVLELSAWRQAMLTVDPAYRVAKGVEAIAYEIRTKKLPSLDFEFPAVPRATIGRPKTRGSSRRRP